MEAVHDDIDGLQHKAILPTGYGFRDRLLAVRIKAVHRYEKPTGEGAGFMDGLAQALCFFCAVTSSPPHPQLAREFSDVWYTHEIPAAGTHLLRLSTTGFLLDGDGWRAQRLDTFAQRFADWSCGGRFTLAPAERPSWPATRPVYARQYVFRCR